MRTTSRIPGELPVSSGHTARFLLGNESRLGGHWTPFAREAGSVPKLPENLALGHLPKPRLFDV